jgi:hypothetical protein
MIDRSAGHGRVDHGAGEVDLLVWLLPGDHVLATSSQEGADSPAPSGHTRCYWTVMLPCIHGWMTHR